MALWDFTKQFFELKAILFCLCIIRHIQRKRAKSRMTTKTQKDMKWPQKYTSKIRQRDLISARKNITLIKALCDQKDVPNHDKEAKNEPKQTQNEDEELKSGD